MKYLKALPAPLIIIALALISSGCSKKDYDIKPGEKIMYPSGDGVLLGACEKWSLKDDQIRKAISLSKPYEALPYGEYSQTPCNMSGTVTINGKTWDYLLNGGGIITLSIDGMVRYRGCDTDACKPYLLLPYRGKSFAVKDTDSLVTEEESTEGKQGKLLSRQNVAHKQTDPAMVSGSPNDGTLINENGPLLAGKEVSAEQPPRQPVGGQMRKPDAQAVPAQNGANGQKAPLGRRTASQNAPVYTDMQKAPADSGRIPSAQDPANNGRVPSVPSDVSSGKNSSMPSVDIGKPTISAPEVGISVPVTSAPSIDVKAPSVSLPNADISIPVLNNPF